MLKYNELLYNAITDSKAYDGKSAVRINVEKKDRIVIDNIKGVIVAKEGVLTSLFVRYDKNAYADALIKFRKYKQHEAKTKEEYTEFLQDNFKSEKGFIDAIVDGLKPSNLEYFILWSAGFTPDELQKEKNRLLLFCKNQLKPSIDIKRNFKRLIAVAIVHEDKPLTAEATNYFNDNQPIADLLKQGGFNVEVIEVFKPERDEYGLLKNFEINSKDYMYEQVYDSANPEKGTEYTKLSKWRYDQIENAKKTLEKKKEEAEKAKVEAEKNAVDEVAINLYLNKIMTVLRDLYKSCFGLKKPVGLLVPEGILYSKEGLTQVLVSKEYGKLYDLAVSSSSFCVQPSGQFQGIDVHDLYKIPLNGTYFPLFHLAVMQGRTSEWVFRSWDLPEKRKKNDTEIETTLEKELSKLIKAKLIETYKKGEDLASITNKLCTSFVVTELAQAGDKSTLMIKLKLNAGNAKFSLENFCNTFESTGDTYLAGGAKITQRVQKKTGVSQVSLCLNEELYQKMPLFAYDAVEHKKARGQKISIRNCIIGQTTDDEILTIDLTKNDTKVLNIQAGPRAGKGVLTLNILGTILSDGCPLIYMDAKPDMSNVLNDLANSKGLRVAAWDLNTPPMEYIKDNPVMQSLSDAKISLLQNLGKSAPEELSESTSNSTWGLLAYLKVLQFTMVSAKLQKEHKLNTSGAGHAFFVLDELLRVFSELDVFYNVLQGIVKDKNTDEALKLWCEKLLKWVKALGQDFAGAMVAEMPNSFTNVITLYQKASTWQYKGKPSIQQSVFTPITTASNATKLVGGSTATSEGGLEGLYALQMQAKDLALKVTDYNHFGMFKGTRLNDAASCTVFKPYLVLNTADIDSQYVEDMSKNIGDKAFEDLLAKGGGEVPPGVGFEGFMNTIGEEGIQNLSRGYEYLTEMLQVSGLARKYSSIEEYLYDADINSFYSKSVLIEGRAGEVVEANKPKSDTVSSGSWNLDETGSEEEIDLFTDNTSNTNFSKSQTQQTVNPNHEQFGSKPQSQSASSSQYQQQTSRPQQTQQQSQPEAITNEIKPKIYPNAYTKKLDIPQGSNPFKNYKGDGVVSTISQLKEMTKLILQDISSVFGGLDRVATFRVTNKGTLIINDMAYQPTFDNAFLKALPFSIQGKVASGSVAELFDLSKIYQFKNLQSLIIDSQTLAQGRARRELGLKPRERYNVLFKVFRQLQYINAGGIEYRGFNPDEVVTDTRDTLQGYSFGERMKNLFSGSKQTQPTYTSSPRMEAFWNSKPIRLTTNALGWTLGTKAVLMSAAIFGPWSLLFGAFMLAGKYNDYKEKHPDKPQPRQYQQNRKSGQSQSRNRDGYYIDNDYDGKQGRRPSNNRNNKNSQYRSNNNQAYQKHNDYYK